MIPTGMRFWAKTLVLGAVIVAAIGYVVFLCKTSWYQPTETLLLHAKDYRFHFRWNFPAVLSWLAASAAVCLFAAATRVRPGSATRLAVNNTRTSLAIKMILLTTAVWIAFINAFSLEEWDWFVLISAGVGAGGLLWAYNQTRVRTFFEAVRRIPRLPLLLIAATATLMLMFYVVHQRQAIATDAQSQIAQARLILSGRFRLILSEPLLAAAQIPNFLLKNPTYSQYPPGHIILLLPFIAAGIPGNVVNILCGIATVGFAYKLCESIAGRRSALFAGILLVASPLFLVMQSSGFNHGSTTMMLMIAAWAFYTAIWKDQPRLLWIGVFGLGWAGITRPPTALAHGLIWGPVLAAYGWQCLGRYRLSHGLKIPAIAGRNVTAMFMAGALPLLLLAVYNALTTGSPFLLGYSDNDPVMHRLGFFSSGPYPYSVVDAAHYEVADIMYLSRHLFGWPFSSGVLLLGWLMMTRFTAGEIIIAALIATQVILYRLYHYHDLLMGPRFMSELNPFFAVLGGIGLGKLIRATPARFRGIATTAVVLFALSALVSGTAFWKNKLSIFTTKHLIMEEFMKTLSGNEPRVIVVMPEYGETAGEYVFNNESPIWFVSNKLEEKAHMAPELEGYQWLHPLQFNPDPQSDSVR